MGKLQIISRNSQPLADRKEVGILLEGELKKLGLEKENPAVVAILWSGIVVGREVARLIQRRFDIALSRKLGFPFNPELAIGAISESGELFINERIAA